MARKKCCFCICFYKIQTYSCLWYFSKLCFLCMLLSCKILTNQVGIFELIWIFRSYTQSTQRLLFSSFNQNLEFYVLRVFFFHFCHSDFSSVSNVLHQNQKLQCCDDTCVCLDTSTQVRGGSSRTSDFPQ